MINGTVKSDGTIKNKRDASEYLHKPGGGIIS